MSLSYFLALWERTEVRAALHPANALTRPSPIGISEGKTGFDHVTRCT